MPVLPSSGKGILCYSGDRNTYIDSFNAYPLLIIDDLSAKEKQCEAALDDALAEFQQLSKKADAQNPDELWVERLKFRDTMSMDTKEKLKAHFDSSFSPLRLQNAQKDVGMYLEQDEQSLRRYADRQRCREQEIRRAQKAQNPKKRDYER